MRKAVLLGIAKLALALPVLTSQAADYRWLNSFDRTQHASIPNFVEPYLKAVEAASGGSIKFVVSGPETVPPFEQLQPVASGAFQFLYTHGAYHFGITPLLAAIEALGGTREQRKASGVFDAVDQKYQKLGLKLIAIPMTPDGGYQIVLKKPPTAGGDLQGYKIRGNPTYLPVIRMLGASMVTLPPADVYTALDKGVVDGFAWLNYSVLESRLYEPAKYLLRPAFGVNVTAVLVNLGTWNKLSAAERKILLDEAVKAEDRWYQVSAGLMTEDEKNLLGKGMQIAQMGEAQKAKLRRTWSDGLWELAAQKHRKDVDELRALARAKGLD